jgi:hypothetical protein
MVWGAQQPADKRIIAPCLQEFPPPIFPAHFPDRVRSDVVDQAFSDEAAESARLAPPLEAPRMPTSKPPEHTKTPSPPTDPVARRDQLLADLEKAAKTAKGSLLTVLQKMSALLSGSRPGGALDKQLFHDFQEAFAQFSQDGAASRTPPVLMESLEWVHTCFIARASASSASGASAAKLAVSGRGRDGKDSFESSGATPKVRSLTGEVPQATGPVNAQREQQEQLESMKNWMLNPGLGKVRG